MGGHVTQDLEDGLDFTVDGETWIVDPFVIVQSSDQFTVFSANDDGVLRNFGTVFNHFGWGVFFLGEDGVIDNRQGALIKGGNSAIFTGSGGANLEVNNRGAIIGGVYGIRPYLQADDVKIDNFSGALIQGGASGIFLSSIGATIDNSGTIKGLSEAGVLFTNDAKGTMVVNNSGDIFGDLAGVAAAHSSGKVTINNEGLIDSDQHGVQLLSAPGLKTVVDNAAGATIRGDAAAISSVVTFGGALDLNNRGTLSGGIDLDAANEKDVITNSGKISGNCFLGSGNDSFKGASSKSAVKVFGEDGNDTLIGGAKADTLNGGGGTDTLRGGGGRDLLTGGNAADTFDFNKISESKPGSANRDQILDFNSADTIDLGGIDANTKKGGNQAFKFISGDKFSKTPGELRFKSDLLQADVNGDGKADFEIKVVGDNPVKGDFIL